MRSALRVLWLAWMALGASCGADEIVLYDNPDGKEVGRLDDGFERRVIKEAGDWQQVRITVWTRRTGKHEQSSVPSDKGITLRVVKYVTSSKSKESASTSAGGVGTYMLAELTNTGSSALDVRCKVIVHCDEGVKFTAEGHPGYIGPKKSRQFQFKFPPELDPDSVRRIELQVNR